MPQPSIQVAITEAGTSAMAPPRIPLGDRRGGVVYPVWHYFPPPALPYYIRPRASF